MSDEEDIFEQALRIGDAQQREAFLDRACADQPQLRQQVERLLKAHDRTAGILESPVVQVIEPPASEKPGALVGNYKLLEQIGEGGMGVVYMAEQLRPVKRRVALKILKAGLDTKQVIARFEAERQALAMMDHPNIARVFDAGVTDAGRPYFAMELVRGIPITQFCDQERLPPRQRLELFVQVCQAVQHAHQKGIIHRDLKPTNVLVTLADDGKPVSKIIDFGIAKATGGQRLVDQTLFTEFRQLIGTPLYMSPEQAERSALQDVDTRSDVYSLGVLLYELLTGTTPFDKQRLATAAYDEVRRIIREEEPPRPSTRLSTLGEKITAISAQRQTDPRKLSQTVRGDLDWIVMKALEKERGRRYETANGLARDIERYLADQPVEACPPSRVYRFRKMFRRNKAAIATAGALVGMLVVAATVSTWQAVRATRAESKAVQQTRIARAEADDRKAINRFLTDMLASADPHRALAVKGVKVADLTVTQMLDRAVKEIDAGAFKSKPQIEASLRTTIGQAYTSMYRFDSAQTQLEIALRLTRSIYGENDHHVAGALDQLSRPVRYSGNVTAAESMLREAIGIQRAITGRDDSDSTIMSDLASVLATEGKLAEAEGLFRRILALRKTNARSYSDLAFCLLKEGKFSEAEQLSHRAIELLERQPPTPYLATDMQTLAESLKAQHKWDEADHWYRQAITVDRRLLGCGHRETLDNSRRLEEFLVAQGKHKELRDFWREMLAAAQAEMAAATTAEAKEAARLAVTTYMSKVGPIQDPGEAVAVAQELVAAHPLDATYWNTLGVARFRAGDYSKAIEALDRSRELIGETSLDALSDLLDTYTMLDGQLDKNHTPPQAAVMHQNASQLYEHLRKALASDPERLAALSKSHQDIPNAIAAYSEALKRQPDRADLWAERGDCHRIVGNLQLMRDDYSQAIRLDPGKQWYWHERGYAYLELSDYKKSIADHSKAIELGDADDGQRLRRGIAYEAIGELQSAKNDYSRAIQINPRLWSNWFARARLFSRMGEADKARADIAAAVKNCNGESSENDLAWVLATSADPALRDAEAAVAIAQRVVASNPRDQNVWNTLGVARYRAGEYAKAIEALGKSLGFKNEQTFAWDAFFLAMAHCKLSHLPEARTWYAQATEWMDTNQPHNEELLRFRAEAEALINLSAAAAAPTTTTPTTQP